MEIRIRYVSTYNQYTPLPSPLLSPLCLSLSPTPLLSFSLASFLPLCSLTFSPLLPSLLLSFCLLSFCLLIFVSFFFVFQTWFCISTTYNACFVPSSFSCIGFGAENQWLSCHCGWEGRYCDHLRKQRHAVKWCINTGLIHKSLCGRLWFGHHPCGTLPNWWWHLWSCKNHNCFLNSYSYCKSYIHKHVHSMVYVHHKNIMLGSNEISHKSWASIVGYSQKRNELLLFSIVLRILQLLITLEPLVRFRWGFQQNVPLQMSTSNRKLKMSHVRLQTDFPRLHHIWPNMSKSGWCWLVKEILK